MPEGGDSTLIEILLIARDQVTGVLADASRQAKELRGTLGEVKGTLDQASSAFEYTTTATGAFTWATEEADDAVEELTLQTTLLNVALALAGKYALDLAIDMAMLAGRADELQVVVDHLGQMHGISTEALAAYREEIEAVGVAKTDTLQVMARFLGMQLDLNQAVDLARVAQNLAVIGSQDTSEAFDNITYAIGSMHPRILRQYQIYIDLNKVWKDTAETLGKQQDELTELEKRQGMLNAVLEAGADYVGVYGKAIETASKQVRTMRREIKDMKTEIGDGLQPVLLGIVTILRDFIGLLSDLPDSVQNVLGLFLAWGGATMALWKGLGLLSVTVAGPLVGAIVLLTGAVISLVGAFKQVQGETAEFRRGAIEAAREAGLSWDDLRAIMESYYESLSVREKIAWQMQGGLRHQLELMKLEWQGVQGAAAEAADVVEGTLSRVADMGDIVAEALEQAMAELETIPDRAEAIEDMKGALISLIPTAKLFSLDMEDMADMTGKLAENMIVGTEAARGLTDMITSLALPTQDAIEVMKMLGLSTWDAEGNLKDLDQIMAEFIERTAELGVSQAEQLSMLEALVGRQALPAAAAIAGIGGFAEQAGQEGAVAAAAPAQAPWMQPVDWENLWQLPDDIKDNFVDLDEAVQGVTQSLNEWSGGGAGGMGGGGGGAGGMGGLPSWMQPVDWEKLWQLPDDIVADIFLPMIIKGESAFDAIDNTVHDTFLPMITKGDDAFDAMANAIYETFLPMITKGDDAFNELNSAVQEVYLPMIMESAETFGQVNEAINEVYLPMIMKGMGGGGAGGMVGEFGEVPLPELGGIEKRLLPTRPGFEPEGRLMPITPEDEFSKALFGSGGRGNGKISIEIPLYLNGKEIARAVSDDLGQAARRRGG